MNDKSIGKDFCNALKGKKDSEDSSGHIYKLISIGSVLTIAIVINSQE